MLTIIYSKIPLLPTTIYAFSQSLKLPLAIDHPKILPSSPMITA
ncbi:MAG: hypothetical protein PHH38_02935 [Candidatus Cloacimonetes bacterium]|nr:hypothetical protein [Candidatus Cloacimonadota bacterium]